jgi:hypothetical protein
MFLPIAISSGMGKIHLDHRVVVRDQTGKIVADHNRKYFASAKPLYDELAASLDDGHEVSLQHGARVIFREH